MNRYVPPLSTNGDPLGTALEEMLVPDVRGHLSPAQMVERKLEWLLRRLALSAGRPGLVLSAVSQNETE